MRLSATLAAILMASAAAAASVASAAVIGPITLAPPASQLGYTVFALGFIPINAVFQDFSGTLTVQPGKVAACAVDLTVRIASLHMADPARNRLALSAAVLDAARYPTMHFAGHCVGGSLVSGGELAGRLTLHGVTRPVVLAITRDGTHVTATGMLLRQDYAIGGLPGLVGQHIRFRLEANLPAETASIRG